MANQEAVELAQLLKEWHENRIDQLRMVADAAPDIQFKIQGEDGERIDLPEKHRFGFQQGVKLALDMIQPFPITISKNDDYDN